MDHVAVVRRDLPPVEVERGRHSQYVDPALRGEDQQIDKRCRTGEADQDHDRVGNDSAEPVSSHVATSGLRTLTTRNNSVTPIAAAITITYEIADA